MKNKIKLFLTICNKFCLFCDRIPHIAHYIFFSIFFYLFYPDGLLFHLTGLPNQLSKREKWRRNSNCARTMMLHALNVYFGKFYMLLLKTTFIKKTEKTTRALFILIQNMGWRRWCLSASSLTRAARHSISLSCKVSAAITSIFPLLRVKKLTPNDSWMCWFVSFLWSFLVLWNNLS